MHACPPMVRVDCELSHVVEHPLKDHDDNLDMRISIRQVFRIKGLANTIILQSMFTTVMEVKNTKL